MTPLVTIGIPCYNSERWLKTAIDSALAQTHPRCEVIVVNDASTDNTVLVASAFGDRITLLRNPGRGANVARNQVLKEARGEWIQFLDADDYLLPEKIAQQLAEAKGGDEADVLYSPVVIEETKGDHTTRQPSPLNIERDLYSQWLTWELPQTGGCLWRRTALETLGGWRADQPCCQEHELYMRALQGGLRFQRTETPGAVYRIWSEETLCRKDPRLTILTRTKLIDAMLDWLKLHGKEKQEHRDLAGQACFEMARTLAQTSRADAASYLRERRKRGLVRLSGPAAPKSYRAAYRLLGFRGAERLARMLR